MHFLTLSEFNPSLCPGQAHSSTFSKEAIQLKIMKRMLIQVTSAPPKAVSKELKNVNVNTELA